MDFADFCRRERPRLVGALSLYCGDPALAEEFAQEALARAWRDWSRVSAMAAPGAWVHRVAMNLGNSFFRRRQVQRRVRRRQAAEAEAVEDPPPVAEAVTVRAAVAGLPEPQRRVLVLRYYRGLSVAEVAEATGRSRSGVTSLTHRAVAALRAQLGDDVDVQEDPADVS